jgi:large subunit ribosomal protein L4
VSTAEPTTIDLETASPSEIRRFLRPAPQTRTAVRRSIDGTDLGTVDLEPTLFGIEPNLAVLHQVVTAQLAAARSGTQSTKTRSEVRGGGTKPFRQKGTGRARAGSSRSPIWVGGGVALGPKPRSYRQKTPKKMIALALRSALSDRAADGKVVVVDAWPWETPSTKAALAALAALGLSDRVLVVLDKGDEVARRSFRNLPEVQLIKATELNAYDILVNDWVVFTRATLPGLADEVLAEALAEAALEEMLVEALVDEGVVEALADEAVEEVVEAVVAAELVEEIVGLEAAAVAEEPAAVPGAAAPEAAVPEAAAPEAAAPEADEDEGEGR